MSDFGVWESIETSDSEKKIASRKSEDKLAAAIYDVKDKYGEFLYASTALDEFHDRVALVKTDMMKTVDAHLMPVTGVMRRVIKACKDEWRYRTAAPSNSDPSVPYSTMGEQGVTSSGAGANDIPGDMPYSEGNFGGDGISGGTGGFNQADGSARMAPGGTVTAYPQGAPHSISNSNADPVGTLNNISLDVLPGTAKRTNFGYGGGPVTDPTGGIMSGPYGGRVSGDTGSFVSADSGSKGNSPLSNFPGPLGGAAGQRTSRRRHAIHDQEGKHWSELICDGCGRPSRKPYDVNAVGVDDGNGGSELIGHFCEDCGDNGTVYKAWEDHGKRKHGGSRRRADMTGPAMDLEETFTPSDADLVPEGNFDGYLAEVEQGAPEKAGENFIEGRVANRPDGHSYMNQDGTCPDCFWGSAEAAKSNPEGFAKYKRGDGKMSYQDRLKHFHPNGSEPGNIGKQLGPLIFGSVDFQVYKDYCETNGLRVASIDSLDHYAENLSDAQYFRLASMIERLGAQPVSPDGGASGTVNTPTPPTPSSPAEGWGGALGQGGVADPNGALPPFSQNMVAPGQIAASRRSAAGSGKTNYLQKADEALTQVLESKAEEFQETIAPLQQALQVIQQAEQAEQAANPMGVQPPPGTVNVLPGQDPSMGGGDPSMGGGDPSMGGDPMAGGGADLAQALGLAGAQGQPTPGMEGAQQQITGRRRKVAFERDIIDDFLDYLHEKGDDDNPHPQHFYDFADQVGLDPGSDPGQWDYLKNYIQDEYGSEIPDTLEEFDAMPKDDEWDITASRGGRQDGGAYPFVREGGIVQQYNSWLKKRPDLPRGGEADYWAFAREHGFGQNEVSSLINHFKPKKAGSRKTAWTGWGPSQAFAKHRVAGWEWDDHLNGYVANKPHKFACSCGDEFSVPSYHNCKCGKIYNSYVIGTGGDNHTASIEKYICREIQVRPDVIVANRQAKRHKLTDPGALDDGEEDDLPTMKPVPGDWRRRNEHGQFSAKRR